jgi:hypothetical protein
VPLVIAIKDTVLWLWVRMQVMTAKGTTQLPLVTMPDAGASAVKQLPLVTLQANAIKTAMQSQLVLTLVNIINAVVQWPLVNMQDKAASVAAVVIIKVVTQWPLDHMPAIQIWHKRPKHHKKPPIYRRGRVCMAGIVRDISLVSP